MDRAAAPLRHWGIGGETVPHLATALGAKNDPAFQQAYWRSFERTFGEQNARMVKSMLLEKLKHGDTGDAEIDRVCLGLRTTMGWLADAIERTALHDAGYESKRPPGGGDSASSADSEPVREEEELPASKKRVLPS